MRGLIHFISFCSGLCDIISRLQIKLNDNGDLERRKKSILNLFTLLVFVPPSETVILRLDQSLWFILPCERLAILNVTVNLTFLSDRIKKVASSPARRPYFASMVLSISLISDASAGKSFEAQKGGWLHLMICVDIRRLRH